MSERKMVIVPAELTVDRKLRGELRGLYQGLTDRGWQAAYKHMLSAAPPVDAVTVPRELLERLAAPGFNAGAQRDLRALLGEGLADERRY